MAVTTIRPNANYAGIGGDDDYTKVSDDSDATFSADPGGGGFGHFYHLGTFAIPAGHVVTELVGRARCRNTAADGRLEMGLVDSNNDSVFLHGPVELAVTNTGFQTKTFFTWDTGMTQAVLDRLLVQIGEGSGSNPLSNDIAEVYVDVTTAAPPGAPTFTAPGATVTTTRKPLINWNFIAGTDGPSTQAKFRVKVYSAAQYGAGGFNPDSSSTTQDSGKTTSSTTQWTPTANLANGTTYRAYVQTYVTTHGIEQTSAWGYVQFTISIPLSVPTSVVPANASTQTTGKPAIGATIATQTDSIKVKREWQVASNTGFSTDLQTYSDSTTATTKSGTIAFPTAWTRLAQGTRYVRCRTVDEYGQTSAWSSTNTFTVAHVPTTANRAPAAGVTLEYDGVGNDAHFSWTFSDIDTTDSQTKYHVELWKLSTPAGVLTTGEVTSTLKAATITGLDSTWKDTELRWRVRVADIDGVWSAWSTELGFFLRDLPVPNVTAPVGALSATSSEPTVTWSFTAAGGRTQANFQIVVTDTDASQVVADSGTVTGADVSWTIPTPVISVGVNYQIDVIVTDSSGLVGTDTDTFTATFVAGTTPTFIVTAPTFEDTAKVTLDWSGATQDPTALGWRVYRRLAGDTIWVLVHETLDPNADTWDDYTCPANLEVEYAMAQLTESVGETVESAYAVENFTGSTERYFLVCQEDPTLNLVLWNVNSDSFSDEQEMAEVNLKGRGRQVQYGTRYGQRGSLSATFYNRADQTARQQRLALEAIRDSGLKIHLRNPFGDVWEVGLPTASIRRIAGVGLHEAAIATIDYVEITA